MALGVEQYKNPYFDFGTPFDESYLLNDSLDVFH